MIFFFNDTATTEIYTLSLHDALPISTSSRAILYDQGLRPQATEQLELPQFYPAPGHVEHDPEHIWRTARSEEHTSELQSRQYLVCRLLLEKKKKKPYSTYRTRSIYYL